MVKGKQGLYLEAWKFSIYITIPIFASMYYSNPETQKYWADYWQFIKYPENPNVNVKEQIEELMKQRKLQEEQTKQYSKQLYNLQLSANRNKQFQKQNNDNDGNNNESISWWKRVGRWITGNSSNSNDKNQEKK